MKKTNVLKDMNSYNIIMESGIPLEISSLVPAISYGKFRPETSDGSQFFV
jgi:hypothetical protein